ncbi:DUF4225 domain-containing protein [Brenneria corticis]|uniref:DUF4225 domain-containing protein n=1 Tax=Brenneria corticis TaxID=2173106 RepID=A0A2U1TLK3_9GAMM|nr:DUF4225 domain-containing protein [Brenneria sp. CFCC 11842]PWC10281.1 hypothetical protein DDT56_22340 [Brenneria sp. CFCC 11842]
MDIYLGNNGNRFSNYFLSMANLEAQNLRSTVYAVSAFNIKDGLTRVRFQTEIQAFIDTQLRTIRNSNSQSECQECLQNLKIERDYLLIQDRMLRSGQAVIHASVELIKGYEKEIGYIINGIGVVVGVFQVVVGFGIMAGSVATGNVLGIGAGFMITMHGINSVEEKVYALLGEKDHTGFVKSGYIATAEFLGFDQRVGREAYTGLDVALSVYGLARLTLKPDTWRLFRYMNTDYVRNFQNMSKTALALKIVGNGPKLKLMYDIHTGKEHTESSR